MQYRNCERLCLCGWKHCICRFDSTAHRQAFGRNPSFLANSRQRNGRHAYGHCLRLYCQNCFSPAELPVGIVISIIGVPYFIYLLFKDSKK